MTKIEIEADMHNPSIEAAIAAAQARMQAPVTEILTLTIDDVDVAVKLDSSYVSVNQKIGDVHMSSLVWYGDPNETAKKVTDAAQKIADIVNAVRAAEGA